MLASVVFEQSFHPVKSMPFTIGWHKKIDSRIQNKDLLTVLIASNKLNGIEQCFNLTKCAKDCNVDSVTQCSPHPYTSVSHSGCKKCCIYLQILTLMVRYSSKVRKSIETSCSAT